MKIGILQTGRVPENMQATHGDYDDIYQSLLGGRGFEFDVYAVLDGVLPDSVEAADGWIITGSKFSAYGGDDWIAPLEEFLRQAYAKGVPIVGVCFGHQILAQALGGKVEKYSGGWSVGATSYEMVSGAPPQTIMAWHQDQITRLPAGATVTGRSDFCKYAMLAYGTKALSIQAHPEFTPEFMDDLIEARRDILPDEIVKTVQKTMDAELSSNAVADQFEAFFKMKRRK
ncbi:MAG: type 1 glutamine amidotransferase [Devosiaceae bacterium]|nr:type 1 glutamine amidotransferase [Devosiaceae bacterium]